MMIRDVTANDAAALAAIYAPIVTATAISFEEVAPDAAEMARRIAQRGERHPWLVADDDEAICGYAYAAPFNERAAYRWSVATSVYVAETSRGRGVGRALYEALFAALAQRGFHRAFAGITLPNEASLALHRALGFEPVGVYREAGRKFDRWLDVMWLQRAL